MVPWYPSGSYVLKENNMALSLKARKRLEVAMARRVEAKEIADAIDTGGNAVAATVAASTSIRSSISTCRAGGSGCSRG